MKEQFLTKKKKKKHGVSGSGSGCKLHLKHTQSKN